MFGHQVGITSRSFHYYNEGRLRRKGPRCAAVPQAPLSGTPLSLTPRSLHAHIRTATRELVSAPRLPSQPRSVAGSRARAKPHSLAAVARRYSGEPYVTSSSATRQPCGEVKLSNVIHFRIPVSFYFSGPLHFSISLCYLVRLFGKLDYTNE